MLPHTTADLTHAPECRLRARPSPVTTASSLTLLTLAPHSCCGCFTEVKSRLTISHISLLLCFLPLLCRQLQSKHSLFGVPRSPSQHRCNNPSAALRRRSPVVWDADASIRRRTRPTILKQIEKACHDLDSQNPSSTQGSPHLSFARPVNKRKLRDDRQSVRGHARLICEQYPGPCFDLTLLL